jgi:hypothetical protein
MISNEKGFRYSGSGRQRWWQQQWKMMTRVEDDNVWTRMWRWWTTMAAVAAAVDNDKDSG